MSPEELENVMRRVYRFLPFRKTVKRILRFVWIDMRKVN